MPSENRLHLGLVSIDELRGMWGWYSPRIQKVIDKCELSFFVEDVYRELTAGAAHVYGFFDDNDQSAQIGFLILSERTDRYSLERVLFIDMGYLEPNVTDLEAAANSIMDFAGEYEFDRVDTYSPRSGWLAKSDATEFFPQTTLFSRRV